MTITYSLEVSKARLGGFAKLLIRWRGSIYRLMYREMFVFTFSFYAVAFMYRYALPDKHQRNFEILSMYCREFLDVIPITFVMGFYVSMVVGRWWQMYLCIPWPDKTVLQIAAFVQGMDERGRIIRRTLARYLNIISTLTFQATSTVIKKRFPTIEHMVEAGILTQEERLALEHTSAPHGNWWLPSAWYCQLAMVARKEGRIHDDLHLKSIIDTMLEFRGNCGMMWSYDWISIPLVYTQVVTLTVYSFFIACLIGRQYLLIHASGERPSNQIDYYFPIFTMFQFFFYVGWLKVAEEMICPFGEDDDDFELNWILDRNLQVSYLTVDELYRKHPKLTRDMFWDEVEPDIPYTNASAQFKTDPFLGSTLDMNIPDVGHEWMSPIPEERIDIPTSEQNDLRKTSKDNDIEGSKDSLTASPPTRPRHLHQLLPGDSRVSLASRFGSKVSVGSGSQTPHSPLIRRLSFLKAAPQFRSSVQGSRSSLSKQSHHSRSKNASEMLAKQLSHQFSKSGRRVKRPSEMSDMNIFYTTNLDADEFRYPTPFLPSNPTLMNSLVSLSSGNPKFGSQMSQPLEMTGIDILNELVSPEPPNPGDTKSPRTHSLQHESGEESATAYNNVPDESDYLVEVGDDWNAAQNVTSSQIAPPSSLAPPCASVVNVPPPLAEVPEEGSDFGSTDIVNKPPSWENLNNVHSSRQNSGKQGPSMEPVPEIHLEGTDTEIFGQNVAEGIESYDDSMKPLIQQ